MGKGINEWLQWLGQNGYYVYALYIFPQTYRVIMFFFSETELSRYSMRSFLKNRKKKTIYIFLLLVRNISIGVLKVYFESITVRILLKSVFIRNRF